MPASVHPSLRDLIRSADLRRERRSKPRSKRISLTIDEPDCLFRPHSLDRLREAIRPALARLVGSVAIPAVHQRHRPFGVETPIDIVPVDPRLSEELARLLLTAGTEASRTLLAEQLRHGLRLDSLLLSLMRGAEATLDGWFDEDRCSSFDVTLAICALRTLATEFTRDQHRGNRERLSASRRACIIEPAGDSLSFAPMLHECYLRMAGWEIEKLEGRSAEEVCGQLRDTHVDLAVCVLNDEALQDRASDLVREIRRQTPTATPLFIGTGHGFARISHRPCQAGLDTVVSEPSTTLLYATHSIH
jgi:hypothetical protein